MKKSIKSKIKLFLRYIISSLLYYTGFLALYRRCFLKDKAIILVYHRVIDFKEETIPLLDGIYVTKQTFQKHMKYLSKNHNVVSLEELIDTIKRGRKFKDYTCAITFDDGWQDNYKYAFPILKKFNLPATILLTTGFIGKTEWFWQDKVMYLIYNFLENKEQLKKEIDDVTKSWNILTPLLKNNTLSEEHLNEIINKLKELPINEIDKIIDEMKVKLKIKDFPSKRLTLNWEEIDEMANDNITFGSHTVNHPILTNLSDDEITTELSISKKTLDEYLSIKIRGFCYPNGDYNAKIKKMTKENGYGYAVTTQKGFTTNQDDLYGIKRIAVHNDIAFSKSLFACYISLLI